MISFRNSRQTGAVGCVFSPRYASSADRDSAEWIARQLEAVGYSVLLAWASLPFGCKRLYPSAPLVALAGKVE
ncbi:MAG: hypothetical protein JOZ21_07580 [Verrucomicrobia bacterium]|nr:hypothetical protein [Verrucomicrobiota bacterium]